MATIEELKQGRWAYVSRRWPEHEGTQLAMQLAKVLGDISPKGIKRATAILNAEEDFTDSDREAVTKKEEPWRRHRIFFPEARGEEFEVGKGSSKERSTARPIIRTPRARIGTADGAAPLVRPTRIPTTRSTDAKLSPVIEDPEETPEPREQIWSIRLTAETVAVTIGETTHTFAANRGLQISAGGDGVEVNQYHVDSDEESVDDEAGKDEVP